MKSETGTRYIFLFCFLFIFIAKTLSHMGS